MSDFERKMVSLKNGDGVRDGAFASFDIKVMHVILWLSHAVRRIVQRRCMETHGAQAATGTASAINPTSFKWFISPSKTRWRLVKRDQNTWTGCLIQTLKRMQHATVK